ncbi:LysR family transcriptional regulator [Corynebacterium kutscheri]|uniref:LysR family regulator n=1 Tax=Corynebacterium kutscheri TaxID=35755 RepID=A0A0F6R0J0_9CORY|nr:LysR family transcriptional regulator substrate-binding protein [Corynebacterium kutscheri]AKE41767.1 LysR family regulator [Corynebacterium kutscheri]VEH09042.1 LysR family transcriptional regulator [Corynebacterium kutscheri]VEH10093.1 LysR family transcriptional regulator [Corynebacterium kutscheri]VEH80175.1 LysR family transcriptional regulator [Corynebacterium kutscheri]
MLRLSFITGTEPDKWFDRFNTRTSYGLQTQRSDDPLADILNDSADLVLTRLPDHRLNDELHKVVLYEEALGVALPKEHTLTLVPTLSEEDISEEIIHYRSGVEVDIPAVRNGLQLVAANVGIVIAPRPLLKVLSGKLIEHRGFSGQQPSTQIALVWKKEKDSEAIQDFVGIAKGRTPNSSRQTVKKTAKQKTQEKAKRRQATIRKGGVSKRSATRGKTGRKRR